MSGYLSISTSPRCASYGERGLSQEEFDHRAGLHYTYIGGIERGERNPELVNSSRIAVALGVSLAEFFSVLRARPKR